MSAETRKSLPFPRAILFDLDGTLIDSVPDLAASVNELLESRGLPELSLPEVRSMIGNGVRKLVERAFAAQASPLAEAELDEANREMVQIYSRQLTRLTSLLPGAQEAIAHLHINGVKLGVVTNKPQVATREILLHFGLTDRLGAIVGGDAVTHMKPAPDALFLALDQLGVEPGQALMVGDSITDVEAARAAGIPVVLIRGGYTQAPVEELGADLICDSLKDLPAALNELQKAA
jgi:phosphoglycolate phosphatase